MPKLILQFALLFSLAACGAETYRIEGHLDAPDRGSSEWVLRHSCFEQMGRPTFSWKYYKRFLAVLKDDRYVVVPLRELNRAKAENPDKVVVGMRHDLDGNICKSRRMAYIERQAGIRSTYYIRHTDAYYSSGWPTPVRHEHMVWRYQEFETLGHEVGLHFDVVSMALEYGWDPDTLMHNELFFLRGHGLLISGVSSHGSPSANRNDFNNYEYFAGMTTRESVSNGRRTVRLGEHTLAEYALAYEAYHLDYDYYYSDVSGKWGPANPIDALASIPPGKAAVILTHPVWWGTEDAPDEYL